MSQEHSAPGNLGEDVPPVMQPTSGGAPQPPHPLPLFGDGNLPSHTPGWYWHLFNDPILTPPPLNLEVSVVTAKAFQGLTNQVQTIVGMLQAIISHILQLTHQPSSQLQAAPLAPIGATSLTEVLLDGRGLTDLCYFFVKVIVIDWCRRFICFWLGCGSHALSILIEVPFLKLYKGDRHKPSDIMTYGSPTCQTNRLKSVAAIFRLKVVNSSNVGTTGVKSTSGVWQPRVAVMVEEEEGSSNVSCDCAATSWLQVASVAARVRL
ncbi:hypothetical protein B296_00041118 [Ensete ventricosum]|uniref:Uncharacterized protein n=1 Tax=Ensete ventricosum TaxID=4639 RepID=A0A426XCN5_ENSVE|nr:hypothetical protein B296_00041118 [Ensete ventricosum]